MSDFIFEIDFEPNFKNLISGLSEIEKSTTQSADQIKKVFKEAFTKLNLKEAFKTQDISAFNDTINDSIHLFTELAQEGQVPLKILKGGFNELQSILTSTMKSMKVPKELRSEYMAEFSKIRDQTRKLLTEKHQPEKVKVEGDLVDLVRQLDAVYRKISSLTSKKHVIDLTVLENTGKKFSGGSSTGGGTTSSSSTGGPVEEAVKTPGQLRSEKAAQKRIDEELKKAENKKAREDKQQARIDQEAADKLIADKKRTDAETARQKKADEYRAGVEQRKQERKDAAAKREAEYRAGVEQRKQQRQEAAAKREAEKGSRGGKGSGGGGGGDKGGFDSSAAINFLAFNQLSNALKALSSKMIEAVGAMEQYKRRLQIVTKGIGTEKKFKFAREYERVTPYDLREVMQTATAYATQEKTLKKLGIGFEDAIKTAGELGSINPEAGIVTAQQMMSRIYAGDPNGLEIARSQFGISNDILADKGVQIGYQGVSLTDLTNRKKVITAINEFINETTKGVGAVGQSTTIKGKLSTLYSQAFSTLNDLMEPAAPAVLKVVEGLTSLLQALSALPKPLKLAIDTIIFGISGLSMAATGLAGVQLGKQALGGLLAKKAIEGAGAEAVGSVAGGLAGGLASKAIPQMALPVGAEIVGGEAAVGAAAGAGSVGIISKLTSALSKFFGLFSLRTLGLIGAFISFMILLREHFAAGDIKRAQNKELLSNTEAANNRGSQRPGGNYLTEQQVKDIVAGKTTKAKLLGETNRIQDLNDQAYVDKDQTNTFIEGDKKAIEEERNKLVKIKARARLGKISLTGAYGREEDIKKLEETAALAETRLNQLKGKELTVDDIKFKANIDEKRVGIDTDTPGARGALLRTLQDQLKIRQGQAVNANPADRLKFEQDVRDLQRQVFSAIKDMTKETMSFIGRLESERAATGKSSYSSRISAFHGMASNVVGAGPEAEAEREGYLIQARGEEYKLLQASIQTTIELARSRYGEEYSQLAKLRQERKKELQEFSGNEKEKKKIVEKYNKEEITIRDNTLKQLIQMERDTAAILRNIKAAQLADTSAELDLQKSLASMRLDNSNYVQRRDLLAEMEKTNTEILKQMKLQYNEDIKTINKTKNEKINDITTELNKKGSDRISDPRLRKRMADTRAALIAERDQEVSSRKKQYRRDTKRFTSETEKAGFEERKADSKAELDTQVSALELEKSRLETVASVQELEKKNKSAYIASLKEQFELEKAISQIKMQKELMDPHTIEQEGIIKKKNQIELNALMQTYVDKVKEVTAETDKQNKLKELEKNYYNDNGFSMGETFSLEDLNANIKKDSDYFRAKAGLDDFSSTVYGQEHGYGGNNTGQDHGFNIYGKGLTSDEAIRARFGFDNPEFSTESISDAARSAFNKTNADNIQGRFDASGKFQATGPINPNINITVPVYLNDKKVYTERKSNNGGKDSDYDNKNDRVRQGGK